MRSFHPRLLSQLNSAAIAWYDRIGNTPQPSIALMAIGAMFSTIPLVLVLISLLSGDSEGLSKFAIGVLYVAAFTVVAVLTKLYLIDWPRLLVRRRWPTGAPPLVRFGWIILLTAMMVLSSLLYKYPLLHMVNVSFSVCLICLVWLLVISQRFALPTNTLTSDTRVTVLVANLPLLLWWMGMGIRLPDGAIETMGFPIFSLMLLSMIGLNEQTSYWINELKPVARQKYMLVIGVAAIFSVLLAAFLCTTMSFRPLAAAIVLSLILFQRPLAFLLSSKQHQRRIGLLVSAIILLSIFDDSSFIESRGAVVFGGCILFSGLTLLTAVMALINERNGETAEARFD